MKRILIFATALLLCVGGQVFAQQKDNYRQKVEVLMAQGGEVADMEKQIREALEKNLPAEAYTNDTLRPLIEYMQNGLVEDILNSYDASMRKYVSEAELDELIAWAQKPESKAIREKEKSLATRIQEQDPEALVYLGTMMNGMLAVVQGNKPEPLPKSGKKSSYKKAFHQYYEASNASATLRQTFEGILGTLGQYLQGQPEAEKIIRRASDYMVENLEPLMLLMYEDIYTEADLRYQTAFCRTPAYQHQSQANAEFTGGITDLIMQAIGKIVAQ